MPVHIYMTPVSGGCIFSSRARYVAAHVRLPPPETPALMKPFDKSPPGDVAFSET